MKNDPQDYLYEEYGKISGAKAWAIVIGLAVFLILSGLYAHWLLPDKKRDWHYGALDTVPGDSIYSSMLPNPGPVAPDKIDTVPRQLAPKPGAKPLEKLPPRGYEMGERPGAGPQRQETDGMLEDPRLRERQLRSPRVPDERQMIAQQRWTATAFDPPPVDESRLAAVNTPRAGEEEEKRHVSTITLHTMTIVETRREP